MKMTSTSFNVGLTDNTRLSSRVLRPPGGGHTDIFGGEPEQPPARRNHNASSITIGAPLEAPPPKPTNGTHSPNQNGAQSPPEQPATPDAPAAPSAPAAAPAPPEPKQPSSVAEPARAEPPKRVRVPPGGFSSGLW